MPARAIELDHDQCCEMLVDMLEEFENDMIDAAVKAVDKERGWLFSTDIDEERKQIRKMLKAIKRVKSWYVA